ncbi:hypothetical protein [Candidatus Hepatoplasma crinochetorum]|uniref:Uncharacterized protein n=1 Tax=Candidatus Hepatoplasma crinochetorum Av TaxID=1427984 RepID=W8GSP7_9MOLU|nr:hypothetical protein [Candidatus Hepatoplasma crinochetorum]AHK22425.1 hypothetical protein X271_00319 [Candidatus Hepatoplasma crinochetorum Av]
MENYNKNNYKLSIETNNFQSEKPDLIVLFCLKEFKNEIKEIDKKFHSFIHWYDEKFKKIYEIKKNFNEFLKLKNSSENNSILYSGLENKIDKYSKKINKYKKEYQDIFFN